MLLISRVIKLFIIFVICMSYFKIRYCSNENFLSFIENSDSNSYFTLGMMIWCILQSVKTTVRVMASVTRPPSAVSALAFGWRTFSVQTFLNSKPTVVTYVLC